MGLLLHASLCWRRHEANFLMSLSMVPVIRIVSIGLLGEVFPGVWRYVVTSLPLFTMAFFLIQTVPLAPSKIGMTLPTGRGWLIQGLVAVSGIGIGTMEYMILRPAPLAEPLTLGALWWPALVLIIGTGLLEELIFRGILQATAGEVFGRWLGIGYVSLLFGLLHSGYRSPPDVIFVIGVALFFAVVVARTRSLTGVAVAHGLTNVMLFLIAPNLVAGSV
jgi:membrane protease YdiL (CAAX protease family)